MIGFDIFGKGLVLAVLHASGDRFASTKLLTADDEYEAMNVLWVIKHLKNIFGMPSHQVKLLINKHSLKYKA